MEQQPLTYREIWVRLAELFSKLRASLSIYEQDAIENEGSRRTLAAHTLSQARALINEAEQTTDTILTAEGENKETVYNEEQTIRRDDGVGMKTLLDVVSALYCARAYAQGPGAGKDGAAEVGEWVDTHMRELALAIAMRPSVAELETKGTENTTHCIKGTIATTGEGGEGGGESAFFSPKCMLDNDDSIVANPVLPITTPKHACDRERDARKLRTRILSHIRNSCDPSKPGFAPTIPYDKLTKPK